MCGRGDQKFELVLWGDKVGFVGFKKAATVVFYDVWIRKNTSDRKPTDRMEFSGSLSAFGFSIVDTLIDDVVRAFAEAKSPARKRKLSELAGMALAPDANETNLRVQLTKFSMSGIVNEIASDVRDDSLFWAGSPDCYVDAAGLQELLSFLAAQS